MSVTSDILFGYLRDVFYAVPDADLELDKLEEDYVLFGKGLLYFAHCMAQYNDFANALAKGDLSAVAPPPENELAAPLKTLQANLKHLTWQSQQVAKGDYKQRVDFMGDFADAFNSMVELLADREKKLEDEIEAGRKHAKAMEQSNLLLSKLMRYFPEQIIVVSEGDNEVLLTNDMAKIELEIDPDYFDRLMKLLPEQAPNSGNRYVETQLTRDGTELYLAINAYQIEWREKMATAMIVNDISAEKKQLRELENFAYRDALTHTNNRFYGMLKLNEWLEEKKLFALIFVDLDNLKYINDVHGHPEGDEYIKRVARHLQTYSREAVICRVGGDEYMVLASGAEYDEAFARMNDIQHDIQNDKYLYGKEYFYSISFGIVSVDADNNMTASDVLSLADERMYEHKRARKKDRKAVK